MLLNCCRLIGVIWLVPMRTGKAGACGVWVRFPKLRDALDTDNDGAQPRSNAAIARRVMQQTHEVLLKETNLSKQLVLQVYSVN